MTFPARSVFLTAISCSTFLLGLSQPTSAQQFERQLLKSYLPNADDATWETVLGDFDGDGDLDLLVLNPWEPSVHLRNRGDGVFDSAGAPALPASLGLGSPSVEARDLDGDGDLDLAVAGGVLHHNQLFFGDGSGGFVEVTSSRLPGGILDSSDVAIGDVDRDGDLDLVFANTTPGFGSMGESNSLYFNDGNGGFSDVSTTHLSAVLSKSLAVELAYVDGDFYLDLLLLEDGVVRVLLNDKTGRFLGGLASVPGSGATDFRAADFDGDGNVDIALVSKSSNLWLGDGAGGFTPSLSQLPIQNYGLFEPPVMDVFDSDGDGDMDVLIGSNQWTEPNQLLVNNGAGVFADQATLKLPGRFDRTTSLSIGDVDGNGSPDILLGNLAQNAVLLGTGSGSFLDGNRAWMDMEGASELLNEIEFADIDSDGQEEFLVVGAKTVNLMMRIGGGGFEDVASSRLPLLPTYQFASACFLDVENDGDLDLLFGLGAGGLILLLNDGSGFYADVTASHLPSQPCGIMRFRDKGDVNGDGYVDLVFGTGCGIPDRLYLGSAPGVFTLGPPGSFPLTPTGEYDGLLADCDNDGDLDFVIAGFSANTLYLNDGLGVFLEAPAGSLPPISGSTFCLAAGDLNGDGKTDLVLGNGPSVPTKNSILMGTGAGSFVDVSGSALPISFEETQEVHLVDVDEDLDLDIVVSNFGLFAKSQLLINDGGGLFVDATALLIPETFRDAGPIGIGDADGDGDVDFVAGYSQIGRPVYLFANRQRQLSAPHFPTLGQLFELRFDMKPGYGIAPGLALPAYSLHVAPLDLGPLGTLFLDLTQLQTLPSVPLVSGAGTLQVAIPSIPGLVGLPLYFQALIIDDFGVPHLTGYLHDQVWF